VLLNGNESKLRSRRLQFPIFDTSEGYEAKAAGMIDGVSRQAVELIAAEQPYVRRPDNPRNDPLSVLQDLNNTDKHRMLPVTVIGLGIARADDSKGRCHNHLGERVHSREGREDGVHSCAIESVVGLGVSGFVGEYRPCGHGHG